jgi:hypothetical protein
MPTEITIILKDEERIYKQKFLTYSEPVISETNAEMKDFIDVAKKNFMGTPQDITIRTLTVLK